MIDHILTGFFTPEVISKMGDWYEVVYSWSTFSLILLFGLFAFVMLISLLSAILRWFK